MSRQTERALKSFLRGLAAEGKHAKNADYPDLVSWSEANGYAASCLLRDMRKPTPTKGA